MSQIHWDRNEKTVVAELALQYIIVQVSIIVAGAQSREWLSVALAPILLTDPIPCRRVKNCLLSFWQNKRTYLQLSHVVTPSQLACKLPERIYLNADVIAEVLVGHEKTVWFSL